MDEDLLIQTALECGADKAVVINAESIVLNPEFRNMCEANQCGMYGRCYMCPPDAGSIDTLMAQIGKYEKSLLYQTISPLEDSFDFEGMVEARRAVAGVSQRLLDRLQPVMGKSALHLSVGGCGLCERCAKETGEPCRHPDRALASLESYGVDVYNTVRNTGLKYTNGPNTVTYFGMVLYSENEIAAQADASN